MSKIAIVTDSAAGLPVEEVARYGITVVPYHITFGERDYRDGIDLSVTEFYRMLREFKRGPVTSAPSVGDYMEAYRQAAKNADVVINITLSAAMSHAYASARAAAREPCGHARVHIIDSGTAAGAQGLVVLAAARRAKEGDEDGVVQAVSSVASRVRLVGFLETLEYAKRSGRVPRVASWAASVLSIRPVVELRDGKVSTVGLTRTRRQARERLLQVIKQAASSPLHIAVQHADAREEAEELFTEARKRVSCVDAHLLELTPVVGAHSGPGMLAIAFWADSDTAVSRLNHSSGDMR